MTARFLSCSRGSAAVETALVLPMFLTLGLAAADAGALFGETHQMKAGLATAARYLARAPDPAAATAEAKNLAVTGKRTGGDARVKGWAVSQVTVTIRTIADPNGNYAGGGDVRVVRAESVRPYTGLGMLALVGMTNVQVRASHEERWTG